MKPGASLPPRFVVSSATTTIPTGRSRFNVAAVRNDQDSCGGSGEPPKSPTQMNLTAVTISSGGHSSTSRSAEKKTLSSSREGDSKVTKSKQQQSPDKTASNDSDSGPTNKAARQTTLPISDSSKIRFLSPRFEGKGKAPKKGRLKFKVPSPPPPSDRHLATSSKMRNGEHIKTKSRKKAKLGPEVVPGTFLRQQIEDIEHRNRVKRNTHSDGAKNGPKPPLPLPRPPPPPRPLPPLPRPLPPSLPPQPPTLPPPRERLRATSPPPLLPPPRATLPSPPRRSFLWRFLDCFSICCGKK